MWLRQYRAHAAHISAPFRGQSARLPGAVSIDPAQLNSTIKLAAAHPLNRARGGSDFAPLLSPRLHAQPAKISVPVHVNRQKLKDKTHANSLFDIGPQQP